MSSSSRKSGIPIMKSGKTQNFASSFVAATSSRSSSGIPRRATAGNAVKHEDAAVTSSNKEEDALKKQVARLKEDVEIRESTITDLNDKLMERMRECHSLREKKEAAMDNFSNQEDAGKVEKLEKVLRDREDRIRELERNKTETERKFVVELDMLMNQHEVNVLSLQQRLEGAHQEKLQDQETDLLNEKKVNGELREELSRVHDEGTSVEIDRLEKELLSSKVGYEDTIYELKEELERERDDKDRRSTGQSKVTHDDVVIKGNPERSANEELRLKFEKELVNVNEIHSEELETLKYSLQEKDIQIAELTQQVDVIKIAENGPLVTKDGPSITEDSPRTAKGKAYSQEQVTAMLDELRRELTRESERNITMANDLWRRKLEEEQGKYDGRKNVHEETTTDDEDVSDDHDDGQAKEMDAREMVKKISNLKGQLEEALELQKDQAEVLEIQEKEMEVLKESNREFEERYSVLFKEMESKWQEEFNESDIIEKIKSHYEMEVDHLHGDLEELQTENSNLKTELDLMANDFGGGNDGRNRMGGMVRRNSVNARLDLQAEVEDYTLQLASLERDLQHSLNENERLKMEQNARGGNDSGGQQTEALRVKISELEQEAQKLTAERDDFCAKLESNKKEKKRIEKDLGSYKEAEAQVKKELVVKCEDMVALEKSHNKEVKRFEEEVSRLRTTLHGMSEGSRTDEKEFVSVREKLEEAEIREKNLLHTSEDFERKSVETARELREEKSKGEKLRAQVTELLSVAKEYDNFKGEYDKKVLEFTKDKDMYSREIGKSGERVAELETMLSKTEKENGALKGKYDELYKEIQTINSGVGGLQTALSQKEKDYEALEVACEKLKSENKTRIQRVYNELEIKLNERQTDLDELKATCDKRNSESEAKSKRICELEITSSEVKKECEQLKVNCDKLYGENEMNSLRICELETTLNEKKIEYEGLKVVCEKLRGENKAESDGNDELKRVNETKDSRMNELETTLNEKKIECKKLKEACEKLKRENATNDSRVGDVETMLNEKNIEYEKLKDACEKLKREHEIKTAGNAELKKKMTEMKKEQESLKEDHEEVVRENETRASRISEMEKDNSGVGGLQTALSQKEKDYEALEVACEKLKSENKTRIQRVYNELEIKLNERQTDLDELKATCDKRNSESEAKSKRICELEITSSEVKKECEQLKVNCDKLYGENEMNSLRICELETTLNEKKIEYEGLKVVCEKLRGENKAESDGNDELKRVNETKDSRMNELETTLNEKKIECKKLKEACEKLKRENATNDSRVGDVETMLNEKNIEYEKLKDACEKLKREHEIKTAGNAELKKKMTEMKKEQESLKEDHEEVVRENETRASRISEMEKEGSRIRKQVLAFEKRVASQERDKMSLDEKNQSLGAQLEEQEREISQLKQKCEFYDLAKNELGGKLESLETTREVMEPHEQRNKELADLVDEMAREKNTLVNKQSQLVKENGELRNDKDRLVAEMEALEGTLEEERSELERKLNVVERKVKEKDRVLTETKKQSRQLKETVREMEEKCSDFQGEMETTNEERHKESKKLREMLENAKRTHSAKEKELKEELAKEKEEFERQLVAVRENARRANQIDVAEITRELRDKLEDEYAKDAQGMREETARVKEENHGLKIQVDDLAIEVSKGKEERYKLEKLKDQFRFQVQNLQQNVEGEREKLLQVQDEHLQVAKKIGEDKEKAVVALNEYESKNAELLSDIERASHALKRTKEKYGKLKEKYTTLGKKYAKLSGVKMNRSDAQVGPDDTLDLSQTMEDLQRSQEEIEEVNCKLREEMVRVREEMTRGHYKIKAVRQANVVLMKQSRCLYLESEENRRVEEERLSELETSRKLNETLTRDRKGLERERKMLESRVRELEEETGRAKEESEVYFVAKNKIQIEYQEKSRECAALCHQLEKVKEENAFLYRQGKNLQSELENIGKHRANVGRPSANSEENTNAEMDERTRKRNNVFDDASPTSPDSYGERFSTTSRASDNTNGQSFEEPRHSTPILLNNVKMDEEKVSHKVDKNPGKKLTTTMARSPNKDTNLQISKNLMNNEFVTEKYLGSTYWETLEFLKKK